MSGRAKGKRVAVWKFDDRDGSRIEVPVYMIPGDRYQQTRFSVKLEELEIQESDLSIDELKTRVSAAIKERSQLEWEPFLHVVFDFDPADTNAFLNAQPGEAPKLDINLRLGVYRVDLATRPDGSQIHRDYQYGGKPRPRDGHPLAMRDKGAVYVLVPNTPENRTALASLALGLEKLAERMAALLEPDRVASSLTRVLDHGALSELQLAGSPAKRRAKKS